MTALVLLVLVGIFAGAAGCLAILAWQMPHLEQQIASRISVPASGGGAATSQATPSAGPAALTGSPAETEAIKRAIQQVNPAVVHVTQRQKLRNIWGQAFPVETGAGTGMIIDAAKGYVLTNAHVVGDAQQIYVRLKVGEDKEQDLQARLVSRDQRHDLAVLQIEAENLLQVSWGDSNKLQMGGW